MKYLYGASIQGIQNFIFQSNKLSLNLCQVQLFLVSLQNFKIYLFSMLILLVSKVAE